MTKSTIAVKSASIRKAPWITPISEDVIDEVKAGSVVTVDKTQICYDWTDKMFYKCITESGKEGWINAEIV